MKTVNFYIGRQLIATFFVTLIVLTFIMLATGIIAGVTLLARGLEISVFFKFILYGMPKALGLGIPMSMLTATILVFSRLSADNEITALRAAGISIWQIVSPCLIFSIFVSGFCLWLQLNVVPHANYKVREIKKSRDVINPKLLLEPGRPIEVFSGYVIQIDNITKIDQTQDELFGVRISELNKVGIVTKDIISNRATLVHDPENKQFIMTMIDANSSSRHGNEVKRVKGTTTLPLKYGEQQAQKSVYRKVKNMPLNDVFAKILLAEKNGFDTTRFYVEIHKRMALALSPFAFLLLGIPFGIRTSRNETSLGLVISVALALLFYVFILIADNAKNKPNLFPELLIWIPNVAYQIVGLWAMHKISRR